MPIRALVVEFIGTFALILIGAGSVAVGVGGLAGAAFAHGRSVWGLAYAYGHISGTHINPAVTVGVWMAKAIDARTAGAYIVAQLLGGAAAGLALGALLSGWPEASTLGATVLAEGISPLQGLAVEVILTFFLVNAVLNTAVRGAALGGGGGNLAGVAIGLTLAACIFFGGPLTGASLNPARTIGPALATGNFANLWLYIAGPVGGAVLAALLYNGLLVDRKD